MLPPRPPRFPCPNRRRSAVSGSAVIRSLTSLPGLSSSTARELDPVLRVFEFRVSQYYSDLIDWSDPFDPLRAMVMPDRGEIGSTLDIDASDEESSTQVHG